MALRAISVTSVVKAVFLLLFFIANRGAYEGYFHGDDLVNILQTTHYAPAGLFLTSYLSPQLMQTNFRPVGHFFFYAAGRLANLHFGWYVLAIHLLHFLNVWLLWRLARKAGASLWAAAAGALFFSFHMGAFDALWKPMYVFDVLCATFCLLSLLAFAGRRWWLSLICFWTAYKAKEVAVMLPMVLMCWEFWLGKREWKRLIPFFAVSACFGIQALLSKAAAGTEYAFHYDASSIRKCAGFYASKLVLLADPAAAVVVSAIFLAGLALLTRDRRVCFGFASALLLLIPMLLLPGRLYGAYLYVPLAAAAVGFAGVADRLRPGWIVPLFFLLWLPVNYAELRIQRKAALNLAQEDRAYVQTLAAARPLWSSANTVIMDNMPAGLNVWGANAAIRLLSRPDMEAQRVEDTAWSKLRGRIAVVSWNPQLRRAEVVSGDAGSPEAAYIEIESRAPLWQLGEGWYQRENRLCWIQPHALARLRRPAGARTFELVADVNTAQLSVVHRIVVEVLVDGRQIGTAEFATPGIRPARWPVPPAPAGVAPIEFRVSPPYRPASGADPRTLGIAVKGFGFK